MVDNTHTHSETFYVFKLIGFTEVIYEAPSFEIAEKYRQENPLPKSLGILSESKYREFYL